MRKSDVIKSKYFRAADMPSDWVLQAEIELARVEKFEGGKGKSGEAEKLVVYFLKQKSGLVCGPVLWDEMIAATGEEDTDLWPGTVIELYRTMTLFGGKSVPAIRVRKPTAPAARKKKPAPVPAEIVYDDEEAEINT